MSNIDDIFIIPDEEKALRAKRKAQLQARKEKNKELRSKIAKSRAIEKSEQKRTVKNNKNDIDDLKEQLRKLRDNNENNIKNIDNNTENNIENNTEKNIEKSNNISVTPKKGPIKKIEILENKIEKIDYNDPNVKNAEKMIKNIDRKVEPQKEVINNVIKKHVFNKSLFKKRF